MKSRGCEETTLAKSHSRTTEILNGNAAVHLLTRRRDEGKHTFHEPTTFPSDQTKLGAQRKHTFLAEEMGS